MCSNGRTVLITGATSGIGLETAERFAEHGFNVYATAREPEKATALQELAKRHPFFIRIVKLDVTDTEENITAIIRKLDPSWGHCPIESKQPIQPVKVHWNISWQF